MTCQNQAIEKGQNHFGSAPLVRQMLEGQV